MRAADVAIAVVAKQCLPGRVKTRLTPPLNAAEAAAVASACLDDTLETIGAVPAGRRILFFEGEGPPAAGAGFEIVPQPPGLLDERLAWLLDRLRQPCVIVGMDTPQVTEGHLEEVLTRWPDDVDAWLGPAADGGFWALALREPVGALVRGVPMSRDDTGARQRARLESAALRVGTLATLTDVDTEADAVAVAALIPHSRFARRWHAATEER
ncbi:TIGR04282 family arsenosugar biosynthesis glycosyltransferase [Microbacterium hominis]|uniref:DUF2064 domain-containing protein n=1 Tax=Microbacterium hominis TaxID=162426 RepID=A0A7D4UI76_9MICO|nr:DUF2064 domain-containing protein [Microbacterium hominis]QKJ19408.1 DUF2064 domain-containing protein [Microbacterium hominis]